MAMYLVSHNSQELAAAPLVLLINHIAQDILDSKYSPVLFSVVRPGQDSSVKNSVQQRWARLVAQPDPAQERPCRFFIAASLICAPGCFCSEFVLQFLAAAKDCAQVAPG
jgi:hypothetical protein